MEGKLGASDRGQKGDWMAYVQDRNRVRTCRPAAVLVPADAWVGEVSSDQHWGGSPAIGCNALRCHECDGAVQQRPDVCIGDEVAPQALAAVPAGDWGTVTGVRVEPRSSRMYACSCRILEIHADTPVDTERSHFEFKPITWVCTGHPARDLPLQLPGGPLLRDAGDARVAVAWLLGEGGEAWTPKAMRSDRAFALNRVLRSLWNHVEVAEALARAAAEHVVDADSAVQSRALRFFSDSPDFPGNERVLNLLQAEPRVFDRADPFGSAELGSENLIHVAARVLLRRILWPVQRGQPLDPDLIAMARSIALATPLAARTLLHAFWDHDRPWLFDHADQLVAGHLPLAAKLFMLPKRGDVAETLRWAKRLAPIRGVQGDREFWRLVQKYLPKAEVASLKRQFQANAEAP
jgi:hypothetical protein